MPANPAAGGEAPPQFKFGTVGANVLSGGGQVSARSRYPRVFRLGREPRSRAAPRTLGSESEEINAALERRFEVTENGCCRAGFWV